jgi:hypothetical protein
MLHPGVVDGSTALTLQAGTAVTAGKTATNSRAMNRRRSASTRFAMSARSSLEICEVAQTLIDIAFVLVALFSLSLFALSLGFSIFILLFFALQA